MNTWEILNGIAGLSSHVWPETNVLSLHGWWMTRIVAEPVKLWGPESSQESINMHSGRCTCVWGAFQLMTTPACRSGLWTGPWDSSWATGQPPKMSRIMSRKRYLYMRPTIRMKRPMIACMTWWHASKDATSMVILLSPTDFWHPKHPYLRDFHCLRQVIPSDYVVIIIL